MKAERVIGQTDMNQNSGGTSRSRITGPNGLVTDGTRLLVSEYQNHRVLGYSKFPGSGLADADFVIGQEKFEENKERSGSDTVGGPGKILLLNGDLFVTDFTQNRVMVFKNLGPKNAPSADLVIGQKDFTSTGSGAGLDQLNRPVALASDGGMLFISDYANNRILAFKKIPAANEILYGYW